MKKVICKMLVVLLAGSFLFTTEEYTVNAADLMAMEKYELLAEKGIFAGIDGNAQLDQNMSRAQFARVAALMLGLDGIGNPDTKVVKEAPFQDVPLTAWYVEEIAAAKEASIMLGIGNGIFNPNGEVSIQELAVVTARMLNLEPVEDANIDGAADWAAGYIQVLIFSGIERLDRHHS